jgi:hypothetical protein
MEMAVLCRELLTSNSSAYFPDDTFLPFNEAVDAEYFRGRVQLLDQVIEPM